MDELSSRLASSAQKMEDYLPGRCKFTVGSRKRLEGRWKEGRGREENRGRKGWKGGRERSEGLKHTVSADYYKVCKYIHAHSTFDLVHVVK